MTLNVTHSWILLMRASLYFSVPRDGSFSGDISAPLTYESLRLTLCTTSFSIQKFCVLPTVYLCVLCGSQNKQRLFLYTPITYRFL